MDKGPKEAYLYEALEEKKVRCRLCHHRCVIAEGKRGICGVRENQAGVLNTLVYGRVIARHIDPIEKKPLYHVFPGSLSYSVATVGCNFKCRFCQNADIAQMPSDANGMIMGGYDTPEQIVGSAEKGNCRSIAYTYTEPTVYFEFAFDTAKLAHEKGIRNVFVTNGYMTPEALDMISPFLDAANVDLKAFSEKFYKDQCSARLEPVKASIIKMKSLGIFVEVTTLVIPGLNDLPEELENLAAFLVTEVGPETPWHISAFHPTYKLMDRLRTPVQTLATARRIGLKAGLRYVYTGNVIDDIGSTTFCYNCGEKLIERWGFDVRKNHIENSHCPVCGVLIDGLGM
jgi:pyruvate formate lyase activating enzyme